MTVTLPTAYISGAHQDAHIHPSYRFADIRVGFAATCIDSVGSNYQPLSFGSHIHTLNRTAVLVCGYVQYMCTIVLQSCEVQNLVPY